MLLTLKRIPMKAGKKYQIGHLYVDGEYFCDTIEDLDRGLTQDMPLADIIKIKVKNETAIPRGKYRVLMNRISPKFSSKTYYWKLCKGKVPYLAQVPGFEGILIHKGVNQNSSAGCIIVGSNTVVGQVTGSQAAFEKLYAKLKTSTDNIWIEIVRTSSIGK